MYSIDNLHDISSILKKYNKRLPQILNSFFFNFRLLCFVLFLSFRFGEPKYLVNLLFHEQELLCGRIVIEIMVLSRLN